MKLTNAEIYSYAEILSKFNKNDINIPIRINFYIQKNIQTILNEANSIDKMRNFIIKKYGQQDPNNLDTYLFIDENSSEQAQKELNDLSSLEQNLKIYKIKLSELVDAKVDINSEFLNGIMFMIEDDLLNESKED